MEHKNFSSNAVVATAIALLSGLSYGQESPGESSKTDFYENRADGWHWYKDPAETVEEEKPPILISAPAQDSKPDGPPPMSAEWLRVNLPVLRDAAIDNPTDNNVAAYFYAQRIMMDKAQVFSDKARRVVNSDPLLDENLRLPFAAAAKVTLLSSATDTKREIISELADKVGLWVFYDETCVYCSDQIRPLNRLAEKHGLTIQIIHRQGGAIPEADKRLQIRPDTGQFENLGINFTPTVMMVVPPDGYYVISQGFSAYQELVDKLVAASNEYGLISKAQYYAASPTSRGVLETNDIDSDVKAVDWEKTEEWVPFIRAEIAKTYGIGTANSTGESNE